VKPMSVVLKNQQSRKAKAIASLTKLNVYFSLEHL